MQTRSSALLVAGWFFLGLAAAVPAQEPGPESRIEILVFNYARVSAETLTQAESRVVTIYRHAGIEMNWVDCPLTQEAAAHHPECLLSPAPARLALRVVAGSMGDQFGLSHDAFGVASFPEDGGFGGVALVCAQCAERVAQGSKAMYAALLGHVMAHELGHLLLGTQSHTPRGLMHAAWRANELQRVAQGSLLFTSQESERMRRQVADRLRVEAPVLEASKQF